MKKEQYIDLIKNNKDTNFIAFAITPLHALGVNATIKYLSDKTSDKIKGYIFVMSINKDIYLDKDNFHIGDNELEIVVDEYNKNSFSEKIKTIYGFISFLFDKKYSKDDILYIAFPSKINIAWIDIIRRSLEKRETIFVLYDEGAGNTYQKSFDGYYQSTIVSYEKKNLITTSKTLIISMSKYLINLILEKSLKSRGCLIDNDLFLKDGEHCIPNYEAIPYYRQAIDETAKYIDDNPDYHGAMLLNTQVISETSLEKNELFIECINFGNKNNIPVIIKPHPRDDTKTRFNNLDVNFDYRKGISQEAIVSSLSEMPKCVVSVFSTTLLTLKLFYNIPAISMIKMAVNNDMNKSERKIVDDFIRNYSKIIDMPETKEELFELLKRYCLDE